MNDHFMYEDRVLLGKHKEQYIDFSYNDNQYTAGYGKLIVGVL